MKKTEEQLINNVIGQLNGVKKMIRENKGCLSVLIQFKAARAALDTIINRYVSENMKKCFKGSLKGEKEALLKKLLKEIIK